MKTDRSVFQDRGLGQGPGRSWQALGEQAQTAAQERGNHGEAQIVDQPGPQQRLDDARAVDRENVPAGSIPQSLDSACSGRS